MDLGPRRCLVCLADRILPETASATRAAATLGASCSQTRMMVPSLGSQTLVGVVVSFGVGVIFSAHHAALLLGRVPWSGSHARNSYR